MIEQLKFAATLLKANLCILKRPYKLNLYLTDRCNCRCKTCNIWAKQPGDELSTEELSRFFRINNYFSWIDITGGEIFLRNDIGEIFDIIIENCRNLYFLHFPTNGILTTRIFDTVTHIKKRFKGRLVITISIDGDKKLHDSLRGFNGCWEKAVETFRRIEEINNRDTFFGYTISKYNSEKFEETFNSLKKALPRLSLYNMHINLAQSSEVYYSNEKQDLLNNKEEILKELDSILSKRKLKIAPFYFLETYFFKLLKKYISNTIYPFKKCMALNSTITINPTGDVYPCLFFNKRLGSLREVNFRLDEILFNKEVLRLKNNILKYCPNHCWTVCEAYPSILSNFLTIN